MTKVETLENEVNVSDDFWATKENYQKELKWACEAELDKLEYNGPKKEVEVDPDADKGPSWHKHCKDDSSYLVLVNNDWKTYKKGDQVTVGYGLWTNFHLMLHYNFCIENNRYDEYMVSLRLQCEKDDLSEMLYYLYYQEN